MCEGFYRPGQKMTHSVSSGTSLNVAHVTNFYLAAKESGKYSVMRGIVSPSNSYVKVLTSNNSKCNDLKRGPLMRLLN